MAWTLERYRTPATVWPADARDTEARREEDPLADLRRTLDRLFYVAVAAFATCLGALLLT